MIETINSIKDERIQIARAVKSRKGRDEHKKILLEGEEIIDWALAQQVEIDFILSSNHASQERIQNYLSRNIEVFSVSEGIQRKVTERKYTVPFVGVAKFPYSESSTKSQFVVVLDDVKDFGNIGTIVRTCHAFGVNSIISTSPGFDPFQKKVIEASRGSIFSTVFQQFSNPQNSIDYLKKTGYQIVVTSPRGNNLQSLVALEPGPVALVVGNESEGVNLDFEKQADFLIQIPMFQAMESLNVGVATGISIYELRLKQIMTMIEKQIKTTLGRELNVTAMLVQKALDVELRKVSDLSSQQVVFMMVLKCDQQMSKEDMCKQFGILESEVEQFLHPLCSEKLIRDSAMLELTDKGEEILAKLWFTIENAESMLLSDFSDDEIAQLRRLLGKIQKKSIYLTEGDY
ncbi:MAG: hypothetical protein JEZ06_02665 [Anaerolineaceae bacterium]|nr:hypothetical protein [Anaerolineaceae bacterium]